MLCYLRKNGQVFIAWLPRQIANILYFSGIIDEWQKIYLLRKGILIMALPTYNKSKRRQTFDQLPKGAYVIEIKSAREDQNKKGSGSHLSIAFDIAEGEYKDFYKQMFERNQNEDKKWPNDGVFYLTVPTDGAQEYVFTNWNTFFADLED